MIDQPSNQTPNASGLMWLDYEADEAICQNLLGNQPRTNFMEIIDDVALSRYC